jgi:hypothetical protein
VDDELVLADAARGREAAVADRFAEMATHDRRRSQQICRLELTTGPSTLTYFGSFAAMSPST